MATRSFELEGRQALAVGASPRAGYKVLGRLPTQENKKSRLSFLSQSTSIMRLVAVAFLTIAGIASASKRGLAWPWFNEQSNFDPIRFTSEGKVSWMYNWETWRPAKTPNVNFIGMQATRDSGASPIRELHNRWRTQGWTDVFSLNEPDQNGISPQDAVGWYMQWINPMTIRKGLPAVTSSTNRGMGLDWLQSFMDICKGHCYHDYINLHWYGSTFAQFQAHINDAHKRFPQENIVISEFSLVAPASPQAQADFFRQAISWLDGIGFVVMYFPFVATSPGMLSAHDGGAISHVGTGGALFNNDGSVSIAGKSLLM